LPDFAWYNILTREIYVYQITIKYTKWQQNGPNCRKIDQHLPLKEPPKFTPIGIFGLKICHLSTLVHEHQQETKSQNNSFWGEGSP
jgi:hypothetical protein